MSHPEAFNTTVGSVAVPGVPSLFFFFKELNQDPVLKPLTEKGCLGWTPGIWTRIFKPCGRPEAAKSIWVHTGLAFHLLFAKFFLIWALMDSWMFLSRAVSPAILTKHTNEQTHTKCCSSAPHRTKKHWNIRAEAGKVSTRGAAEPAHTCTDC